MKAAIVTEQGLRVQDVPVPRPGPEQVLLRLRAIGLNRADLGVAAGHAHGAVGGVGAIPGLEAAGEVVECGADVPSHITPGMRMMGSMGACYAEYAVADWGRLNPLPGNNMGWEVAATLPVALQTMQRCGDARAVRARQRHYDPGRQLGRRADGAADREVHGRHGGGRQLDQSGEARSAG